MEQDFQFLGRTSQRLALYNDYSACKIALDCLHLFVHHAEAVQCGQVRAYVKKQTVEANNTRSDF
jgi:hypothetical protein